MLVAFARVYLTLVWLTALLAGLLVVLPLALVLHVLNGIRILKGDLDE